MIAIKVPLAKVATHIAGMEKAGPVIKANMWVSTGRALHQSTERSLVQSYQDMEPHGFYKCSRRPEPAPMQGWAEINCKQDITRLRCEEPFSHHRKMTTVLQNGVCCRQAGRQTVGDDEIEPSRYGQSQDLYFNPFSLRHWEPIS